MKSLRKAAPGYVIVKTIGLVFVLLMLGALGVDMGLYFTMQNQLQTAADSGALAGAAKLHKGTATDPALRQSDAINEAILLAESNFPGTDLSAGDVELGYVDPNTLAYNPGTFTTPNNGTAYTATGGYNAVRMRVYADQAHGNSSVPTMLARLFGINSMDTMAYAVAVMDNTVGTVQSSGLRPIYGCQAQYEAAKQAAEDLGQQLEDQVIRVYGDKFMLNGSTASCPLPASGNWGFADFNDCDPGSPGATDIADWFANGYPGTIDLGECYSTAPGNFISNNSVRTAIETLMTGQTVILVPLISNFQGSGSNTQVDIVGYSGFVITDYKRTGPESERYIEGYFTEATCPQGCTSDPNSVGGGVVKLRLVR